MAGLIEKFEKKLISQNLVSPGNALLGEYDDELVWNQSHPAIPVLAPLFDALNISTLLFSPPSEPYGLIIDALAAKAGGKIELKDNETRMFLHDIPVLDTFSSNALINGLKQRKCVVVPGHGIVTCGAVSPEQPFVNFSSVLFSCFVKYFSDYLADAAAHRLTKTDRDVFERIRFFLPRSPEVNDSFKKGPFESEDQVHCAISDVGRPMVNYGLVDSVMGNISYRFDNKVHISQTGSFLDDLEGHIDACSMDNSACTGITASSELPTHMAIYRNSDLLSIVHGHPKFTVVLSMYCKKQNSCPSAKDCNTKCPEHRWVENVPIVTGETGSGPLAICNTVPPAIIAHNAVIVYGHGVFAGGKMDFNKPFHRLCDIEHMCREMYFDRLNQLSVP